MKKLLVILMVVAMASFLFVGCMPGVTPEPEPEPEPEPPTTVAPIIVNVTDGAYVNAAEAVDGVTVTGTAPTYSEVKVYIDGICAGTGDAGADGQFTVVVAKADLGADGAKTLYATATEAGLAESAHSNEKKFTLDTVAPKIEAVKARAGRLFVAGTATENVIGAAALSAGPTVVTSAQVVTGTWTVNVNNATGFAFNVSITAPDGTITWYTSGNGDNFAANAPIPGVSFTLSNPLAAGQCSQIVCVAETPEILGRVRLKYNEDVSLAQAWNGAYTIYNNRLGWDILNVPFGLLPNVVRMAYDESTDTMYWTEQAGFGWWNLAQGDWMTFQVDSVADIAGNAITVGSPETDNCVVLAATVNIGP